MKRAIVLTGLLVLDGWATTNQGYPDYPTGLACSTQEELIERFGEPKAIQATVDGNVLVRFEYALSKTESTTPRRLAAASR